jgi:hypothetical protein
MTDPLKLKIALWLMNGLSVVLFSMTGAIIKSFNSRIKRLEEDDREEEKEKGAGEQKLKYLNEKYAGISKEVKKGIVRANAIYQKKENCNLIKSNLNEKLSEIKKELILNNKETKEEISIITNSLQQIGKIITRIEVEIKK